MAYPETYEPLVSGRVVFADVESEDFIEPHATSVAATAIVNSQRNVCAFICRFPFS